VRHNMSLQLSPKVDNWVVIGSQRIGGRASHLWFGGTTELIVIWALPRLARNDSPSNALKILSGGSEYESFTPCPDGHYAACH
jgi:hypothetical protein